VLEAVRDALATTTGCIDDERRRVEACRHTAHALLDIERGLQCRAQILDALHEVVHVDVVRVHLAVAEALHEELHRVDAIIHSALQHRLVAHDDAALEHAVEGALRDRGDLVRVIEVRVEDDFLVELATLLDDGRQRVDPLGVRDELHRHHRRTLGREADAPDVRHLEQAIADQRDLASLELIAVTAGDDDVLELLALGDVLERALPAIFGRFEADLVDHVRIDADRVAARAKPAVDRARVEDEEQRLVGIAMRQSRHRRVGLLVERVERELGMIGQEARRDRNELAA